MIAEWEMRRDIEKENRSKREGHDGGYPIHIKSQSLSQNDFRNVLRAICSLFYSFLLYYIILIYSLLLYSLLLLFSTTNHFSSLLITSLTSLLFSTPFSSIPLTASREVAQDRNCLAPSVHRAREGGR